MLNSGMDRHILNRHLAQVEEHVCLGEQHIARQHEIIAALRASGRDTTRALALVRQFEEMQVLHLAHRDRLLRKLA